VRTGPRGREKHVNDRDQVDTAGSLGSFLCFILREEAEGVVTRGRITRGAGGRDRERGEEAVLKGFEITPE